MFFTLDSKEIMYRMNSFLLKLTLISVTSNPLPSILSIAIRDGIKHYCVQFQSFR